MKITLHQVPIGELVDGYADRSENEEGITGLGGRLNIRPKYQREFVYGMKERNAVMDTVWRGFPLNVIHWVQMHFTERRREMKGVAWGDIYNLYRDAPFKESELRERVRTLMTDSDVQSKSGIYWYVFDGDERHLDIRAFDGNTKREVYERQEGICPGCGKHFELEEMEADHIKPWRDGGRTIAENCQMLCRDCNRRKGAK